MEEASLQAFVVGQAMDGAHGRDPEPLDRGPRNDVGPIAMGMHDIRSDSPAESSDRCALAEVAAASHDDAKHLDSPRFQGRGKGSTIDTGCFDDDHVHGVPRASLADRQRQDNALESTSRIRRKDVNDRQACVWQHV
jgi:hypothetical protein